MEKKDIWSEYIKKVCNVKAIIFPLTINGNTYYDFFELGLKNDDLTILIKKYGGLTLYQWILDQINLFDQGRLEIFKIKELQSLGLLKPQKQFNEEDIIIYKKYFDNIKIPNVYYKKVYELPIEQQLFIIKNYVDKYYFRKDNQTFNLDDYIQECLISLYNTMKTYRGTRSYKQSVEYDIKSHLARTLLFNKIEVKKDKVYTLDEDMIKKETESEMLAILNKLPSRLCIILKCHHYDKMTQEEIGETLGLTRQRVSQIHKEGLKILKGYFERQEKSSIIQQYRDDELERKIIQSLNKIYLNCGGKQILKNEFSITISLLKRYFEYGYEDNQNYDELLKFLDYSLRRILNLKMSIYEDMVFQHFVFQHFELTPELIEKMTFIRADILANINKQKCKKMGTRY